MHQILTLIFILLRGCVVAVVISTFLLIGILFTLSRVVLKLIHIYEVILNNINIYGLKNVIQYRN